MVCRVSDSAKVAGENLPAGQAGTGKDEEMMVAGENTGNGGAAGRRFRLCQSLGRQ